MKRFFTLCLLLSALLVLCVGARAAEARFTDFKAIENQEEVVMLTDLGLFSGYQDGSFKPGNTITRAEIAKVMATIDTREVVSQPVARFADAQQNWAAPYIDYCAREGIISGYTDGTFRPGANVTARELAKMLLIVVGYPSEQFTGADWAAKVDAAATEEGIYGGFKRDKNLFLTRDDACLMVNNALQCKLITGYDAEGLPEYQRDDLYTPLSVLESRFDVVLVTGVIEANAVADLRPGSTGPLDGNLLHVSGYTKDFRVTAQVANDTSLLGRKMTLYARFRGSYNDIIGVPCAREQEVFTMFQDAATIKTLLQYAPISVTEKTRFFVELQPTDGSCLDDWSEGDTATLIDHEGDGKIEYVLVTRAYKPEPAPEPAPETQKQPTD